jgi:2-polyprenyl-3-methyl-5-hydroxy-6-metoxy-1,4-benzoquinol methylase
MSASNNVTSFGWQTSEPPPSHHILAPRILDICKKFRVHKALDFGCGNGSLSRSLQKAGMEVTGCDVDVQGIEVAAQCTSQVKYVHLAGYEDPQKLGELNFDAVISTEVIEHLFLPRYLPRFARAVLRPGGYLIISCPYHGYLKNLAIALLNKWDSHHESLRDGGHIKFWSRKTLAQLIEAEGFQVLEFYGAGRWRFLWKSMIIVAQEISSPDYPAAKGQR